jgi:hypothetical protein
MRPAAIWFALCVFAMGVGAAHAAGKAMTGDELTALLANGKTVKLGGKGTGYSGTLDLKADGTGSGSAKSDDGKSQFTLEGTWEIRSGKFCRKWAAVDGGEEVCETWVKDGANKVKVMNGKKQIGVNSW